MLACFKSHDGSPATRWDLDPERKRLTRKNTDCWNRKTVVLNDIFAPPHDFEQLDMVFKKFLALPGTQFVILTDNPGVMDAYMKRLHRLSEHWMYCDKWLKNFSYRGTWKNIWFGVTVQRDRDIYTACDLTEMPSRRRFIVLEGDIELAPALMVPKCPVCGGRGVYFENPFARRSRPIICRECPGWELPSITFPKPSESVARLGEGMCLRDSRELGGEINWVVVPEPFLLSRATLNSIIASQRMFGTAVYAQGMPRRLRQNPL